MTELQNNLPSGWDSKIDLVTGKRYYINHNTKTTTWEDPRSKYKGNNVEHIPLQDMKATSRTSSSIRTPQIQESSLTTVQDTDESVAKISSMFPTVSDTHIRLLLKKYHNREAVVISALQVEKHPIATPGPFATPPPVRNYFPGLHPSLQMTPPLGVRRGASPVAGRFGSLADSPRLGPADHRNHRPHSSPKLKLRYMKSIFPKAEETVILDVLTSNENNIQKASDSLKSMGFVRRDPVKLLQQQEADAKREEEEKTRQNEKVEMIEIPLALPIKTAIEKDQIKDRLQEQYKDINSQVITIALESVNYDEIRANQILQIMVQEDTKLTNGNADIKKDEENLVNNSIENSKKALLSPGILPVSQSRHSFKSLLITEKAEALCKDKNPIFSRALQDSNNDDYKSNNLSNTIGANPDSAKGPNEKLLLGDYVPWNGPNSDLRVGPQESLAKGPNKNNLCNRQYKASGPNPELCKGPMSGLAKGSMFKQFRNMVIGESRGK